MKTRCRRRDEHGPAIGYLRNVLAGSLAGSARPRSRRQGAVVASAMPSPSLSLRYPATIARGFGEVPSAGSAWSARGKPNPRRAVAMTSRFSRLSAMTSRHPGRLGGDVAFITVSATVMLCQPEQTCRRRSASWERPRRIANQPSSRGNASASSSVSVSVSPVRGQDQDVRLHSRDARSMASQAVQVLAAHPASRIVTAEKIVTRSRSNAADPCAGVLSDCRCDP